AQGHIARTGDREGKHHQVEEGPPRRYGGKRGQAEDRECRHHRRQHGALEVVKDGKPIWTTRIVVGKPGGHATPLLTETMKYITVNPTWNVPPSIIRNEYLPALARDPGALARIGLRISHNNDGSIRIYQPPGDRNALGRIRFNFPNRFLVYQHDTP